MLLFQIPYGRHSFEYYAGQQPVGGPAGGEHRVFLPWVVGGGTEPYRVAEGLYTNGGMTPG